MLPGISPEFFAVIPSEDMRHLSEWFLQRFAQKSIMEFIKTCLREFLHVFRDFFKYFFVNFHKNFSWTYFWISSFLKRCLLGFLQKFFLCLFRGFPRWKFVTIPRIFLKVCPGTFIGFFFSSACWPCTRNFSCDFPKDFFRSYSCNSSTNSSWNSFTISPRIPQWSSYRILKKHVK